jgi:ABC-type multidrug transport system fused ATPase/permease subunit
VRFNNVHFAYDESQPVFQGLSCTVPSGQSVALVGASGSGKTTFISLLLRLYEVEEGRILLNGADLRSYGLTELRQAFGVVPQTPFLFQGTIGDNIRVVRPDATEEEVQQAARIAHIDEFVQGLDHGYSTWVGEGGFNLSGGQKQRIAIARAVLSKARYFIFDEATSALDNESERRIQSAMESLMADHTTFIIAHRLSTVRNVDRVLVFEGGRIVQDGSYEELACVPGIFQGLLAPEEIDHPVEVA